jgi:riboflavin kinase/FMN adenylyltransferase
MREEALARGLEPAVFTFDTGAGFPDKKRGMTRLLSEEATVSLLEELGVSRLFCPPFSLLRDFSPQDFAGLLAGWMGAGCAVCGYDFHFGKNAAGSADMLPVLCSPNGIDVRIIPAVELCGQAVSSRNIRALVASGEIQRVNAMLGRPFSIDFEVIRGRGLGRKLGWPTINQPIPQGFTSPLFGAYATVTRVGKKLYTSVTNVGLKPTVGSDRPLAETYIQGFKGDLYSRRIEVFFLEFLSPEEKFPNLEALKERISGYAAAAEKIAGEYLAGEPDIPPPPRREGAEE